MCIHIYIHVCIYIYIYTYIGVIYTASFVLGAAYSVKDHRDSPKGLPRLKKARVTRASHRLRETGASRAFRHRAPPVRETDDFKDLEAAQLLERMLQRGNQQTCCIDK